jgi:hypothetical protein
MSRVTLYDKDMNVVTLRRVKWLEFTPDPVTAERFSEKVYNGSVELGKATESRLISTRFLYESADLLDYKLLRNELFSIFNPLNDLWIVDEQVPGIMWKVDVESYSTNRINGTVAEVSMVLKSPKTYAQSIGTSLDAFTYEAGLWSYGMGLQQDASTQDYKHSATSFLIYNPSNVQVDPREDELKISLVSSTATGTDITIRNNATGDEWRYQGTFAAGDTLTIDGVRSLRNGGNVVGNTSPGFGLISLATGYNDFTITGISGAFEITFEFPFLYV